MVRWSLYNLVRDRRVVTEEIVEEVDRLVNKPGAGRAFSSFQKNEVEWNNGLHTSFADRLHEMRVPMLIVHGENDGVVPVAWACSAHERIAGSELRVLPGCGHMPTREYPGGFNRLVGRFL